MTISLANYTTTNYYIPLPHLSNRLVDDLPRITSAIVTIDALLAAKMDSSLRGAINGVATLDANGRLTGSQLPGFTGDATADVGSSTLTLTNTGVSPGTYSSITVDAKGRVVDGAALELKTVSGQSITGTGNIRVPYTKILNLFGVLVPTYGNVRWYVDRSTYITSGYISIGIASLVDTVLQIKINNNIVGTFVLPANAFRSVTQPLSLTMLASDYMTADLLTTGGENLTLTLEYNL